MSAGDERVSAEEVEKAKADLKANWHTFCDADPFDGRDTFPERMEDAGLIRCVPVSRAALAESFAAERGIEKGGMMWELTAKGRRALTPDPSLEVKP